VKQKDALELLEKLAEKHGVELPEDIIFASHPYLFCGKARACMIHDDLGTSAIVLSKEPTKLDVAHEFIHLLGHVRKEPWKHDEDEVERRAKEALDRLEYALRSKPELPPILCFPGGKTKLSRILMEVGALPKHRTYVEPFFGGGSLFFAKPLAEVNVINDIDKRLMSFYENLRELPKFDCDMTPSRERFEHLKAKLKDRQNLSPCEYLYLNKWSFNCKMETFSPKKRMVDKKCREPEKAKTCTIVTLLKHFDRYRDKLRRAIILSKDFREVIREYDGPETFFFLDPPYYGPGVRGATECLYRQYGGCDVSPRDVLESVRHIHGKFMITYRDVPEIREIYGPHYHLTEVEWLYSAERVEPGRKRMKGKELLITNYEPKGFEEVEHMAEW